jgi:hypothetical protein
LKNNELTVPFKVELVEQFYKMREIIRAKETQEWKDARKLTKSYNAELNNAVKELVEYAELNGSKSANRYYIHFAKLVNKCLEIEKGNRDNLLPLFVTQFLQKTIYKGIESNTYYKDIYKSCKDKIDYFIDCFDLRLKA